jgi:hypothetical protein
MRHALSNTRSCKMTLPSCINRLLRCLRRVPQAAPQPSPALRPSALGILNLGPDLHFDLDLLERELQPQAPSAPLGPWPELAGVPHYRFCARPLSATELELTAMARANALT